MDERTTQERWEKFILHRDTIIQEANLKGAEIPLNADYPEIILGLQRITLGLPEAEVESLLDDILGEVVVGDYSVKGQAILDEKEAIRQAIIAKDVAVPAETPLSQFPAKISEISGSVSVSGYVVKFIDYDGSLIKEEIVESGGSATPPSQYEIYVSVKNRNGETPLSEAEWTLGGSVIHEHITFSKWIGDYNSVSADEYVGAWYTCDDDKKLIVYLIVDEITGLNIALNLYVSTGVVTFNWDDGTSETTDGTTGLKSITKTFPAYGIYKLIVDLSSGTSYIGGNVSGSVSSSPCVLRVIVPINYLIRRHSFIGQYRLEGVLLPRNPYLRGFQSTRSLRAFVIPQGVQFEAGFIGYGCNNSGIEAIVFEDTNVNINSEGVTGQYFQQCFGLSYINRLVATFDTGFNQCYRLKRVVFVNGVRAVGGNQFAYVNGIREVTLPDTVYKIGNSAFSYCTTLEKLDIGTGLTDIGYSIIGACTGLKVLIIRSLSLPTYISTQSPFMDPGLENRELKIYVPDALVDTYKTTPYFSIHAKYYRPLSEYTE